jgi:magnesium chelatase family protein
VLVGAMNPCPCGFATDVRRECRCTPQQTARYRARLSGPLRDRVDLIVDVPALPPDALGGPGTSVMPETSAVVRARVIRARECQTTRYARDGLRTNAELTAGLTGKYCETDPAGQRLLHAAVAHLALSARAYDRVRKVARTIADLAGESRVTGDHLAEALQFRVS